MNLVPSGVPVMASLERAMEPASLALVMALSARSAVARVPSRIMVLVTRPVSAVETRLPLGLKLTI